MAGGNQAMLSEVIIDVVVLVNGAELLIEVQVGGSTVSLRAEFTAIVQINIFISTD